MVTSPRSSNNSARERRSLHERALVAARRGDWAAAIEANREIMTQEPTVVVYNRLGRALSEMGRFREAYEAYQRAGELEPHNIIAQRNLRRLEPLKDQPDADISPQRVSHPYLFIEETGKTVSVSLVHPADKLVRIRMLPGDVVELRIDEETGGIVVANSDGAYLGMIEPRIGDRMIELMRTGNRYAAAVIAHEEDTLRLMVREIYQGALSEDKMSFPTQVRGTAPRAYIRKDILFDALDDADLLADDEDEDEAEVEEAEVEDEEFTEDDLDDSRI